MRKLIYLFIVIAFVSCKQKTWTKDNLLEKCKTQMGKDKEMNATLSAEQQAEVCDCSADKLLAKYKSKSEADKDDAGVEAIGVECATAVMMPKDNGMDTTTPVDTNTTPADTTNQ